MSYWEKRRRQRAEIRTQLTRGERVFLYVYVLLSWLVPAGAAALIANGPGTRSIGIGALIAWIFVMAVPISPFLRTRIRRRKGERKS